MGVPIKGDGVEGGMNQEPTHGRWCVEPDDAGIRLDKFVARCGDVSRRVALLSGSFAGPQRELFLWKTRREHIHGQKDGKQTNQLHARRLPCLAQEA